MNGSFVGIALAVLATVIYLLQPPEVPSELTALIASIAGTLFGFGVAAVSITLALSGDLIVAMKQSGHYRLLLSELFRTSILLFIAMLVALSSVWVKLWWIEMSSVLMFSFALGHVVSAGHSFYIVIDIYSGKKPGK